MPDRASIDFVLDFSKQTGDYVSISPVDGQVIALAYESIVKRGKDNLLRKQPNVAKECISGKVIEYGTYQEYDEPEQKKTGPIMLDSDEEDMEVDMNNIFKRDLEEDQNLEKIDEKAEINESDSKPADQNDKNEELLTSSEQKTENNTENTQEKPVEEKKSPQEEEKASQENNNTEEISENKDQSLQETANTLKTDEKNPFDTLAGEKQDKKQEIELPFNPNIWAENKDYDTDDEDGWINKDNFNQLVLGKEELNKESDEDAIGVYIMTSDFAMQNMILQIGIPMLAMDGYKITRVKHYILECFTCWRLCRDISKQFCPRCKYAT